VVAITGVDGQGGGGRADKQRTGRLTGISSVVLYDSRVIINYIQRVIFFNL
jgi:hypothetical protein